MGNVEMRVTIPTAKVLHAMLARPMDEHYGLELARAAGLPSGTLYPILARLEQAQWLTSEWEDLDEAKAGRRRRRYYRLTAHGAATARQALAETRQALTPDPQPGLGQAGT